MDARGDLDLYETAYLCGGARRVAMVALVGLCEDGRAEVQPGMHRVMILRPESRDAVEAAVLSCVPEGGRHLGYAVATVASSLAVDAVGDALRERGLVTRRKGTPSLRGRKALRALDGEIRDGGSLRNVAVVGMTGIGDVRLRNSFAIQERADTGTRRSRRWRSPSGPLDHSIDSGIGYGAASAGGWDGGSGDGGGGGDGG
ncbi:TIGR04222 domain-containing membrane protein [Sphaerisporangium aureirubrum]|uniref:TIGR04222 domain-containing membrane protein n=1 Tax=Sphaerisporangium aureirubrum TaxID=1544736 RepID=A0ABW1NBL6_9ACTN